VEANVILDHHPPLVDVFECVPGEEPVARLGLEEPHRDGGDVREKDG